MDRIQVLTFPLITIDTGGSNGNDGMTLKLEDSVENETNERLTFTFGISHWHYAAFTCEFFSSHGTTLKRYLDGATSQISVASVDKISRHPAGHHIQVGGFECAALIYKIRIFQEVDSTLIGDDDICNDSFLESVYGTATTVNTRTEPRA